MTQRGDENFGAVLDSVASIIVGITEECFEDSVNSHYPEVEGNLKAGRGIGHRIVSEKEPSIPLNSARSAIDCLKATGRYEDLVIKGGAPKEVSDLCITFREAVRVVVLQWTVLPLLFGRLSAIFLRVPGVAPLTGMTLRFNLSMETVLGETQSLKIQQVI